MSRSIKRKITVLENDYYWILNGNTIDSYKQHHIRVHIGDQTRSILYIDPYQWDFEIKPSVIEQAIVFAISKGWDPVNLKEPMYISMNEGDWYVLPKDIKFGYQNNHL